MITGISFEEFRQRLAFGGGSEEDKTAAKQAAERWCIDLCGIAPLFFGQELARTTLWTRIDTGILAAASKARNAEEFFAELLTHIMADAAAVSRSDEAAKLLAEAENIDMTALKAVVSQKHLIVIVRARGLWENRKFSTLPPEV